MKNLQKFVVASIMSFVPLSQSLASRPGIEPYSDKLSYSARINPPDEVTSAVEKLREACLNWKPVGTGNPSNSQSLPQNKACALVENPEQNNAVLVTGMIAGAFLALVVLFVAGFINACLRQLWSWRPVAKRNRAS